MHNFHERKSRRGWLLVYDKGGCPGKSRRLATLIEDKRILKGGMATKDQQSWDPELIVMLIPG